MKYLILIILTLSSQFAGAIAVSPLLNFADVEPHSAGPSTTWNLVTTPEQAILTGSQFFVGTASIHGDLDFFLGEPVRYSIESLSMATLNDGGRLHTDILLTDSVFAPSSHRPPVYAENVTTFSPLAAIYLSDSGILDPGHYTFHYLSGLTDGIAANGFTFTMSNQIPDSGSTLTLLGFAIGAIGFYRLKTA